MLTREEIAAMPAGLELNALLAETLLGVTGRMYVRQQDSKPWVPAFHPNQCLGREKLMMYASMAGSQPLTSQDGGVWGAVAFAPPFSTDLLYAKQLQAKLFADGYDLQIWQSHNPSTGGAFLAQASKNAYYSLDAPDPIWAEADTEALVICRVAYLALAESASVPTTEGEAR